MDNIEYRTWTDRVTVPTSFLRSIGTSKGDMVEFKLDEENNKIILTKYQQENKNLDEIKNVKEKQVKVENLNITKRRTISIPKSIFDKYDLSYKPYTLSLISDNVLISNSNKVKIYLTLSNNSNYKFRKENIVSISPIEKELNITIEQNTYNFIDDFENSKSIILEFDASNVKVSPIIRKKPKLVKQNQKINVEKEIKQVKQVKKQEPILEEDLCDFIQGLISTPLDIKTNSKQQEKITKIATINNSKENIRKTLQDMQEGKYNDNKLVFIDKEKLPKENFCNICKSKLSDKDDSMSNNHRICNKCKLIKVKQFFKPIQLILKARKERQ